ncbi:putative phd finger domain protein [Diaporthe ampelina]|uniref:Putative phd finger domain protein n=1 Tax=Diaporthe ampelina TaxID=1214573 RepID=A0A0G2FUK1_9PEZI|nr:putative phd finger domain protein [Diaporthe ampelina]
MAPKTRAQSAAPQQTTSPAAQPSASESPAQPQRRNGPHYTESELERIVAQKEVVAKTFDAAVDEALEHHNYAVAYALRTLYEELQDNARFLLLSESIFRQTASGDSVLTFGLYINPRIVEGSKDGTAIKYFEAEACENTEYVPHPPQPAPYRDLVTLDLSRLQELADNKKRKRDEDNSADETTDEAGHQPQKELQNPGKAEAGPDTAEVEPESVATPPHPSKRQKLQTREPSAGRSAGRKTASASASRGMKGRTNASPLRRKTRSGSVASDSSLSTAKSLSPPLSPPQEVDEDKPTHGIGDVPAAAAAAAVSAADADADAVAAGETGAPNPNGAEPGPGTKLQPIAARPRRAPARGRRNANASSEPNANNAGQQNAALTIPVGDAPGPGSQRSRNPRRGAPDFTPTQKLSEDDLAATRRRAAREMTHRLTNDARSKDDSHARAEPMPGSHVRELSPQSDLSSVPDVEEPEPDPQPSPPAITGRGARATRAAKRQHEEGDGDDAAPTSPDFAPNAEPSTGMTSRAATPVRPAKRVRTGPRLKVSPMKNKAGTAAGNPRARADRASPTMNGNPNGQVDNDDFCSACGGNGEIVCCDGCTRAFHQLCHDPFIPSSVLSDEDEEWYCWDCSIKRDPGLVKQHKGPWGPLMTALDKKHAVSYRLPKKTREYFEGVRTGPDGEYEDFVPQPKGAKKQKLIDKKEFDFHQIVDKDNNPVLCHSFGPLGPAHKFRKIRGQSEIQYAFRRGNVNNGYIEVEDDSEPANHSGFRDPSFGHVYRLSGGGVQADFMHNGKVHGTDESLDSASVEELSAMEEATRKKNIYRMAPEALAPTQQRLPDLQLPELLAEATASIPLTQPVIAAAADNTSAPLTNQETTEHDDESSVTQLVSNSVDAAVASVIGEDATSTTDTIAGTAANVEQKIDQDPTAQAAIDSALTPVSEANKDGDEQTLAVTTIKPAMSGVETPETEPHVPDQATSPADGMELD